GGGGGGGGGVVTGGPRFAADAAEDARVLAARGKLDDCLARLDACGADPGWIALCRRCLSPERDDRPADAGAVAAAVAGLRAEAEEPGRRGGAGARGGPRRRGGGGDERPGRGGRGGGHSWRWRRACSG